MSEIENFGIFEITSSKTFRNCAIQVKNFILRNSLYKTEHPSALAPVTKSRGGYAPIDTHCNDNPDTYSWVRTRLDQEGQAAS